MSKEWPFKHSLDKIPIEKKFVGRFLKEVVWVNQTAKFGYVKERFPRAIIFSNFDYAQLNPVHSLTTRLANAI